MQLDPPSTVSLWHFFIVHHKHASIAAFLVLPQTQLFSTSAFGILSANYITLVFLQTEVTQMFGTFIQVFDFELAEEEMGNLPCFQEAVLHLCIKRVLPQQAWIIFGYSLNRQYLIAPLKNKKRGNFGQCLVTSVSAGIKHQGLLEHCFSCTGWYR